MRWLLDRRVYDYFAMVSIIIFYLTTGAFGEDDGTCEICPANTFCKGKQIFFCPDQQISAAGSTYNTDCKCRPGYYGEDGGACSECSIDHFCTGGLSETACRTNSESPIGSNSSSNCVCRPGSYVSEDGECINTCPSGMSGNGYSSPCTNSSNDNQDMSTAVTSTLSDTSTSDTTSEANTATTTEANTATTTEANTATTTDATSTPSDTPTSDTISEANAVTTTSLPDYESSTPIATDVITPTSSKITFVASLLVSSSTFTPDIQNKFKGGVAGILMVDISRISIASVKEVQAGRRLLATSIEVETVGVVPTENSQAASEGVTSENLNNELASSGISVGPVSQPVVEKESPESTAVETTSPTPASVEPGACGQGMYSSFDKTTCVTCPAGMYSETENADSFATCIACGLSTYSSTVGATNADTCIACEIGKFTFKKGSKYIRQCSVSPSKYSC